MGARRLLIERIVAGIAVVVAMVALGWIFFGDFDLGMTVLAVSAGIVGIILSLRFYPVRLLITRSKADKKRDAAAWKSVGIESAIATAAFAIVALAVALVAGDPLAALLSTGAFALALAIGLVPGFIVVVPLIALAVAAARPRSTDRVRVASAALLLLIGALATSLALLGLGSVSGSRNIELILLTIAFRLADPEVPLLLKVLTISTLLLGVLAFIWLLNVQPRRQGRQKVAAPS